MVPPGAPSATLGRDEENQWRTGREHLVGAGEERRELVRRLLRRAAASGPCARAFRRSAAGRGRGAHGVLARAPGRPTARSSATLGAVPGVVGAARHRVDAAW